MCDHGHSHSCAAEVSQVVQGEEGIEYNMDCFIDKEKVTVLNEAVDGTGVLVFKPWSQHLDRTDCVESDADPELLFNIPFTGHVKLTGITIMGDTDETHPSVVRIFKDRQAMSFSDTEGAKPDQEMQLKQDGEAKIDYPLVVSKFSNVHHLTLFFPDNFGSDITRIYYIGLRGEFQHSYREKVIIANYEARPVPDDHKHTIPNANHHHVC